MAVKIRLRRRGRKKLHHFDLVVADARAPRDGRFIEKLGIYSPNNRSEQVRVADDRAVHWLSQGAQPTDTVRNILSREGILFRRHLQLGVQKGAITQENADTRYTEWKKQKDATLARKQDGLQSKLRAAQEDALAAEKKVAQERAAKQIRQNTPPEEASPEGTPPEEAPPVKEAPADAAEDASSSAEE